MSTIPALSTDREPSAACPCEQELVTGWDAASTEEDKEDGRLGVIIPVIIPRNPFFQG